MSLPTMTASPFDDFEFEAIVADFALPDVDPERPARRPHRVLSDREATDLSRGFRRHRSRERGE